VTEINHKSLDVIRSLGLAGKQDLLQRLVSQYLVDTPVSVNAILVALDQHDFDGIRTHAHTAKSSSAYVGAQLLANRFSEIEQSAREHDLRSCEDCCDGLLEHFYQVESELSFVIQDKAA